MYQTEKKLTFMDNLATSVIEHNLKKAHPHAEALQKFNAEFAYEMPLPWLKDSRLVCLANETETLKVISMDNDQSFEILDGTNKPIYSANKKAGFQLSAENVEDYTDFFFEHVQGRHGIFQPVHSVNDVMDPVSEAESELYDSGVFTSDDLQKYQDVHDLCTDTIKPQILSVTDNEIIVDKFFDFKNTLYQHHVAVSADGKIEMPNEPTFITSNFCAVYDRISYFDGTRDIGLKNHKEDFKFGKKTITENPTDDSHDSDSHVIIRGDLGYYG